MQIVPVIDEGLGNSSYVVDLGDGAAVVVDPFRDPAPYLAIAERKGWRIRFAAETHLHADFISGSRELAAQGAQVLASAGAPLGFDAELLDDGDEVDVGGLVLRAVATPGHTPEHLSYVLLDDGRPLAVFTGGTLIVGGVARPDLLGAGHTEQLSRAAYRSVHERLLTLPDDVAVLPTHGAGSFCSAGDADRRTSTIGQERLANPLLQARDEDGFVARLKSGLGSYPPYFLELRDVNRAGPAVYGTQPPPLTALTPDDVDRELSDGAELVDVRPVDAVAAGHVPGSLSIPMRDQFATWLGWLVGRKRRLALVVDKTTDERRLVRACLGIGYENIAGAIDMTVWTAAGRAQRTVGLVAPADADRQRTVLDVRQHSEWAAGHVAGAIHRELGSLPDAIGSLDDGPLLVHCGHGERAMTAATLLLRAGRDDVTVLSGGPEGLASVAGKQLESGA